MKEKYANAEEPKPVDVDPWRDEVERLTRTYAPPDVDVDLYMQCYDEVRARRLAREAAGPLADALDMPLQA